MRANWQECGPLERTAVTWVSNYVTLNKRGEMHLSRKTWEKLGEPAAVKVYFDDTNNRFGLKPASPSQQKAFHVGKHGRWGGRRIGLLSVMKRFKIDIPDTVQFFDADFDDEGILILDLRTARVPNRVTSQHAARKIKNPS